MIFFICHNTCVDSWCYPSHSQCVGVLCSDRVIQPSLSSFSDSGGVPWALSESSSLQLPQKPIARLKTNFHYLNSPSKLFTKNACTGRVSFSGGQRGAFAPPRILTLLCHTAWWLMLPLLPCKQTPSSHVMQGVSITLSPTKAVDIRGKYLSQLANLKQLFEESVLTEDE